MSCVLYACCLVGSASSPPLRRCPNLLVFTHEHLLTQPSARRMCATHPFEPAPPPPPPDLVKLTQAVVSSRAYWQSWPRWACPGLSCVVLILYRDGRFSASLHVPEERRQRTRTLQSQVSIPFSLHHMRLCDFPSFLTKSLSRSTAPAPLSLPLERRVLTQEVRSTRLTTSRRDRANFQPQHVLHVSMYRYNRC